MTPELWLSTQIKEKGIKQTFIAEKTGIPYKALSATLTGRRGMKAEELIDADALPIVHGVFMPLVDGNRIGCLADAVFADEIASAPTIIPADKEEGE